MQTLESARWPLSPELIERYMHNVCPARFRPRDAARSEQAQQALAELAELSWKARLIGSYAPRKRQQRTMWHSGAPLLLRWVVNNPDRAPEVVWIGQGNPPQIVWPPRRLPKPAADPLLKRADKLRAQLAKAEREIAQRALVELRAQLALQEPR
jgi:hypothetical protein